MLDITASQFMIMYVDLDTDVETKVLCVDNAGRDQQTNNRTSTPPVPVLASSLFIVLVFLLFLNLKVDKLLNSTLCITGSDTVLSSILFESR
jgi:hypothetical protein